MLLGPSPALDPASSTLQGSAALIQLSEDVAQSAAVQGAASVVHMKHNGEGRTELLLESKDQRPFPGRACLGSQAFLTSLSLLAVLLATAIMGKKSSFSSMM